MKMIFCFLGFHSVQSKRLTTREFYGAYSPKGGTKVAKNHYYCVRCGKDFTQEYEMRIYYEAQNREYANWARSQGNKK